MCVTFCHLNRILFFNHEDCDPLWCEQAAQSHPACRMCIHNEGGLCGLTRAPQPAGGSGCCHWSVTLVRGWQPIVEPFQVAPLAPAANETVTDLLDGLDAPYRVDDRGYMWVNPDALGLPDTYGRGTDVD